SSGDDTTTDSGTDATFDGAISDSGPKSDGSTPTEDSGPDASSPPAHRVFVTAENFSGNLVAEAATFAADAGLDAGAALDGGYVGAADTLCNAAAHKAVLKGTFAALVTAGTDKQMARFTDADGPWALVDGTPVADSVADLASGHWRTSVRMSESGVDLSQAEQSVAWASGETGNDCAGWTTGLVASNGNLGETDATGPYALSGTGRTCNETHGLYCAEVGAGAGPNVYPPIPAGGKRVFVADGAYPGNFALSAATLLDASAPDAGDAVHGVGDEICNEVARANGLSGKYHAWLSSTGANAKAYFQGIGMNGPWYRADGAELAADLGELTTTGARTQIEMGPDGGILPLYSLSDSIWTGTQLDGGIATNCTDFKTISAATTSANGRPLFRRSQWTNGNNFQCSSPSGLYCFEE
ncbi:MAG TPA: hypothetical protein VF407_05175, partial [Polyangiaceae bacterium]